MEDVKHLPADPRDMVPSAVRWARAVHVDLKTVPRAQMYRTARANLTAVVWALAAASDYSNVIPAAHTAPFLAHEAGVGDRVWQKRTAWLRERGWLEHGPEGQHTGWRLRTPA